MASATRLPLKSILLTSAVLLGVGASRVELKELLLKAVTGPGKYKRIAILLTIAANVKNLPFVWHYRVWVAILRHFLFSKPVIPAERASSSIFLPVITTSYSPLYECDYNFHKSNSTYFSDLDVTRSHLVCALLQPGIKALQENQKTKLVLDKDGNPFTGRWAIMLGSVMCSFKREIGIYQPFEMWSRVLCWDQKWIYVITHFVKRGTVKPSAYILGDGSWFSKRGYMHVRGDGKVRSKDVDEKAIFATALSKYVMKIGRLTVHPEVVFEASNLLPSKPGGWASMSVPLSAEARSQDVEGVDASGALVEEKTDEWNWKTIEAENKRGLEYVAHFSALDALHNEFTGSQAPALGKYPEGIMW